MKPLFYTILAFLIVLPTGLVDAAGGGTTRVTLENPLKADNFNELLEAVLNILLIFATPIYGLMIAIAAYYFIFGGQNPENRNKSLTIFKYATIGFVLLIFSRAIVAILRGII